MPAEDTLIIRMRAEGGATTEVEISGVTRSMEGVEAQSVKTSKAAGGFGSTMKSLKGIATGIAFGGLALGIGEVAKQTLALQQTQNNLATALKNTHQSVTPAMKSMTEGADALSQAGGFAPTEEIQALTNFTTAGEKATTAMHNLNLATDIARARHLSLESAVKLVSQAEMGRSTGLARLGINIPKVTTAQDALTASGVKATVYQREQAKLQDQNATRLVTLRALQDKFKGSTEAYSKSAQGSWSDLTHEMEVMSTTLGQTFLPMVEAVIKFLAQHKSILEGLVITMAALTTAYLVATGAMKVYNLWQSIIKAMTSEQTALTEEQTVAQEGLDAAFLANPVFLVIAAIVALIAIFVVLYMKVKWFRDFVNDAWKLIKQIFTDVVDFIGDHWKLVVTGMALILGGPFLAAIVFVITHWKMFLTFFEAAWKTIQSVVMGVIHAITGAWSSFVSWIKGAVNDAVHVLSSVWKTLTAIFLAPFKALWSFVQTVVHEIVRIIKWLVGEITPIINKILGPINKIVGAASSVIGAGKSVVGGAASAVSSVGSFLGLQSGGQVDRPGMFTVGEKGPENVYLPTGTVVQPSGTQASGEVVIHNYLMVDGQVMAQAIARASTRQLALR
jgi:hypothetical protein